MNEKNYSLNKQQSVNSQVQTQPLSRLNKEQYDAVTYTDGPILVIAGAGTGKTTVLVERVKYLLNNGFCKAENILATTFTIKATEEMRQRLQSNHFDTPEWIGTFHSLCSKVVRRYWERLNLEPGFKVFDGEQQKELSKKLFSLDADSIMEKINYHKNHCKRVDDLPDWDPSKHTYQRYQDALKQENALDFGDLIIECCRLWRENPDILKQFQEQFTYICIDEFQDTNEAQYTWLMLLVKDNPHTQLFCVGDDDQAIYTWRGSSNTYILNFTKTFPNAKVIKLEQNYRSTAAILNGALKVVSRNRQRLGKTLYSNKGEGQPINIRSFIDDIKESQWLVQSLQNEKGSVAVLVRTGWQLTEIHKLLNQHGLGQSAAVRALINYMKFLQHPTLELFAYILQHPKRGFGDKTIEKFQKACLDYLNDNTVTLFNDNDSDNSSSNSGNKELNYEKMLEILTDLADRAPQKVAITLLNEQLTKWKINIKNNLIETINQVWSIVQPDSSRQIPPYILKQITSKETLGDFIQDFSLPNISALTIHTAKGLEFDSVYLPGWEENIFPHSRALSPDEIEEERRLAYVAITRGKKHVNVSYAMTRKSPRGFMRQGPSRFIYDLS